MLKLSDFKKDGFTPSDWIVRDVMVGHSNIITGSGPLTFKSEWSNWIHLYATDRSEERAHSDEYFVKFPAYSILVVQEQELC